MSTSRERKIFNGILAAAREKAKNAKPPRIIDSRDINQVVSLIIKSERLASDNPNLVKLGLVASDITDFMKQLSQGQKVISVENEVKDKILEAKMKLDASINAQLAENEKKKMLVNAQRAAEEAKAKRAQEIEVADAQNDTEKLYGLCDKFQKELLGIIKRKIELEAKQDISGIASNHHVSGNQKILTSQLLDNIRAAATWISGNLALGESIPSIKDKVFRGLDLDKLKEDHNLDLVKLVASDPVFKDAVAQYDAVARLKSNLDAKDSPKENVSDFSEALAKDKNLSLAFQKLQETSNGLVMSGSDYKKMMAGLLKEEARLKKNYSKELAQLNPVKGSAAAIAQNRVAAIEKQIDEFKKKGTTVGLAVEITYEEASQKLKALAKTQLSTGKFGGNFTRGIFGSTSENSILKIASEIMKGKKILVESSKIEMSRMRK